MSETLLGDLRSFLIETFLFGEDDPGFGPDDSLLERGIVDSTGILEVVEHIEEEYGINVRDEELIPDNFDSIEKLGAYVRRKQEGSKDA